MHHIAMLDDLGFSPFPVPNSKPQTRNPKLVFTPSFTDNELSALRNLSKDHKKSIKFSPKTRSQTEQIAPEEIAIEDFFSGSVVFRPPQRNQLTPARNSLGVSVGQLVVAAIAQPDIAAVL